MHWSQPAWGDEEDEAVPGKTTVRSHTATLVRGSTILVLGGAQLEDKFSHASFDTETQFWMRPAIWGLELPPLRGHTATPVGKRVFVIGGGAGTQYNDTVYVLNTDTMTWWRPQVSGQGPGPLRAHTATAVGAKIYVHGGGDGETISDEVFVLDTDTMRWSKVLCTFRDVKDNPGQRAYHSATLVDVNRILIFGGTDGESCLSHIHLLNTDTLEWKRVKPANAQRSGVWPRLGHTATLVGRMLFVYGGYDGCSYVNELHMLDLDALEWVAVPPISGRPPSARAYHSATFHDSRLFVHGGINDEECFADLLILDIGVLSYLTVPTSERARYTPRSAVSTPTTTPRTGAAKDPSTAAGCSPSGSTS